MIRQSNHSSRFGDLSKEDKLALFEAWLEGSQIQIYVADEWFDVLKPVWCHDYVHRIKPDEPDSIDWSQVNPKWKYMARDGDGEVVLYTIEPKFDEDCQYWNVCLCSGSQDITDIVSSYVQGTVHPRDSLVKRPVDT